MSGATSTATQLPFIYGAVETIPSVATATVYRPRQNAPLDLLPRYHRYAFQEIEEQQQQSKAPLHSCTRLVDCITAPSSGDEVLGRAPPLPLQDQGSGSGAQGDSLTLPPVHSQSQLHHSNSAKSGLYDLCSRPLEVPNTLPRVINSGVKLFRPTVRERQRALQEEHELCGPRSRNVRHRRRRLELQQRRQIASTVGAMPFWEGRIADTHVEGAATSSETRHFFMHGRTLKEIMTATARSGTEAPQVLVIDGSEERRGEVDDSNLSAVAGAQETGSGNANFLQACGVCPATYSSSTANVCTGREEGSRGDSVGKEEQEEEEIVVPPSFCRPVPAASPVRHKKVIDNIKQCYALADVSLSTIDDTAGLTSLSYPSGPHHTAPTMKAPREDPNVNAVRSLFSSWKTSTSHAGDSKSATQAAVTHGNPHSDTEGNSSVVRSNADIEEEEEVMTTYSGEVDLPVSVFDLRATAVLHPCVVRHMRRDIHDCEVIAAAKAAIAGECGTDCAAATEDVIAPTVKNEHICGNTLVNVVNEDTVTAPTLTMTGYRALRRLRWLVYEEQYERALCYQLEQQVSPIAWYAALPLGERGTRLRLRLSGLSAPRGLVETGRGSHSSKNEGAVEEALTSEVNLRLAHAITIVQQERVNWYAKQAQVAEEARILYGLQAAQDALLEEAIKGKKMLWRWASKNTQVLTELLTTMLDEETKRNDIAKAFALCIDSPCWNGTDDVPERSTSVDDSPGEVSLYDAIVLNGYSSLQNDLLALREWELHQMRAQLAVLFIGLYVLDRIRTDEQRGWERMVQYHTHCLARARDYAYGEQDARDTSAQYQWNVEDSASGGEARCTVHSLGHSSLGNLELMHMPTPEGPTLYPFLSTNVTIMDGAANTQPLQVHRLFGLDATSKDLRWELARLQRVTYIGPDDSPLCSYLQFLQVYVLRETEVACRERIMGVEAEDFARLNDEYTMDHWEITQSEKALDSQMMLLADELVSRAMLQCECLRLHDAVCTDLSKMAFHMHRCEHLEKEREALAIAPEVEGRAQILAEESAKRTLLQRHIIQQRYLLEQQQRYAGLSPLEISNLWSLERSLLQVEQQEERLRSRTQHEWVCWWAAFTPFYEWTTHQFYPSLARLWQEEAQQRTLLEAVVWEEGSTRGMAQEILQIEREMMFARVLCQTEAGICESKENVPYTPSRASTASVQDSDDDTDAEVMPTSTTTKVLSGADLDMRRAIITDYSQFVSYEDLVTFFWE